MPGPGYGPVQVSDEQVTHARQVGTQGDAPAGDTPVTAAQLSRLPLILYEAGGNTRAVTDAWFRRAGITRRPVMELGSVEAIKTLVGSGLGAAVLPALALRGGVPGADAAACRVA